MLSIQDCNIIGITERDNNKTAIVYIENKELEYQKSYLINILSKEKYLKLLRT